jgi:hypothetical protein
VFINTVDANTGYTADVAMDSFICQSVNAGYTADAAMHSYICQTQVCSYSSTHFYQHKEHSELVGHHLLGCLLDAMYNPYIPMSYQ